MPELPEVETTKEGIKPFLLQQTITDVIIRNSKLRLPIDAKLKDWCIKQTICDITRRAKYLLIHLSQGTLLIHLGMSGHLRIVDANTPPDKHDHVDLSLNNNKILRYCDPRRFGLIIYIADEPEKHRLLHHLGPEPLTPAFNGAYLYQHTRNKSQAIKTVLMTNQIVVGIGNIYASECLFLARIHPLTAARDITQEHYEQLAQHIKDVLHAAIKAGGTTLKDFYGFDGKPGYFSISLNVYGRKNQPCFNCGTTIEHLNIARRSSTFCPLCQKPH